MWKIVNYVKRAIFDEFTTKVYRNITAPMFSFLFAKA